jgi:hypothetical protein
VSDALDVTDNDPIVHRDGRPVTKSEFNDWKKWVLEQVNGMEERLRDLETLRWAQPPTTPAEWVQQGPDVPSWIAPLEITSKPVSMDEHRADDDGWPSPNER